MERERAVDRLESILDRVDREPLPVPVREVWAYGDVALGLDPIDRLDVYLTKDVLLESDDEAAASFADRYGVQGVGSTVRASWAEAHPDRVRASDNGYAAPEKCLGAELLAPAPDDDPIHLEVCNASFDDTVTQRLRGALARDAYDEVIDPRGVCLWVDGERDTAAMERLRAGTFAMPTLPAALEMLGVDEEATAERIADAIATARAEQATTSVRGDMV